VTGLSANEKWAALDWIARLPLLGAYELAMLLDAGEREAASLLSDLQRCGWLESTRVDSPELEPDRVYTLSRFGVPGLAEALGLGARELEAAFPVGAPELAQRRGRVEITVGLNRFAAELVAAVRREEAVALEDLRALPWRRRSAWWPSYVDAFACLSAESTFAPFFIAWNRVEAPAFHRRRRVSAWYAFREGDHPWSRDNFPSILILCPSEAEGFVWEQAVLAAADRRRSAPLPVLLAEIDAVFSADPLDAVWRRAGGATELPLMERLNWRWTMPVGTPRFRLPLPPIEPLAGPQGDGPHASNPHASYRADLGATEKRLLEWLGFHPLLSAGELAVLLRTREESVDSLVADLAERGLVESIEKEDVSA
jgi:hypothetical protein